MHKPGRPHPAGSQIPSAIGKRRISPVTQPATVHAANAILAKLSLGANAAGGQPPTPSIPSGRSTATAGNVMNGGETISK
jgi:hypothetical protein